MWGLKLQAIWAIIIAFLTIALGIIILVFALKGVLAHGAHQWVADKELADPISHQLCCSKDPSDCQTLNDGDVREVSGGWAVKTKDETKVQFVPYDRGLPASPDNKFHRCGYPTNSGILGESSFDIRCFIIPPSSS